MFSYSQSLALLILFFLIIIILIFLVIIIIILITHMPLTMQEIIARGINQNIKKCLD